MRVIYQSHNILNLKTLTEPLIKSSFVGCTFNTHHTYTNIGTNLKILYILLKGPKLNSTEQYEIYNHYKQSPTNILNDQLHDKTHTLFVAITLTCLLLNHSEPENKLHHSQFHQDCQAHGIEKLLLQTQVSEDFA